MTDPTIQQVIDYIKSVSPAVWAAARQQVLVDSGMCILVGGVFTYLAKKCSKLVQVFSKDMHNCEGRYAASIAGMVVALIVALICVWVGTENLLTLNYSTIKAITNLVSHVSN